MAGEYLDRYTYEYLLEQSLSHVPNTLDKREGSIIFDAIAPICYEFAEMYMQLKRIIQQTYVMTANEDFLDLRVQEQGLTRYDASYATKKAFFTNNSGQPMTIPIGSRFSTIADSEAVNYEVTAQYRNELNILVPGTYILTCESLGTIGNSYTGNLLPITYIAGLSTALMQETIIPARDRETDQELVSRYMTRVNYKSFGGNIAQYREMVMEIDGVGQLQVYPVWDGGGTVKLSVVDAEYNPISPSFIIELENIIDPEDSNNENGTGLGLAPIGHKVTVATPTQITVDIQAEVALRPGYTIETIQPLVEEKIEEYILEVRQQWAIADEYNNYFSSIYIARINAAMLTIPAIINVTNTEINGTAADLTLQQTPLVQELPTLGEVTLSEQP